MSGMRVYVKVPVDGLVVNSSEPQRIYPLTVSAVNTDAREQLAQMMFFRLIRQSRGVTIAGTERLPQRQNPPRPNVREG